jgi:hypothetical protein
MGKFSAINSPRPFIGAGITGRGCAGIFGADCGYYRRGADIIAVFSEGFSVALKGVPV